MSYQSKLLPGAQEHYRQLCVTMKLATSADDEYLKKLLHEQLLLIEQRKTGRTSWHGYLLPGFVLCGVETLLCPVLPVATLISSAVTAGAIYFQEKHLPSNQSKIEPGLNRFLQLIPKMLPIQSTRIKRRGYHLEKLAKLCYALQLTIENNLLEQLPLKQAFASTRVFKFSLSEMLFFLTSTSSPLARSLMGALHAFSDDRSFATSGSKKKLTIWEMHSKQDDTVLSLCLALIYVIYNKLELPEGLDNNENLNSEIRTLPAKLLAAIKIYLETLGQAALQARLALLYKDSKNPTQILQAQNTPLPEPVVIPQIMITPPTPILSRSPTPSPPPSVLSYKSNPLLMSINDKVTQLETHYKRLKKQACFEQQKFWFFSQQVNLQLIQPLRAMEAEGVASSPR